MSNVWHPPHTKWLWGPGEMAVEHSRGRRRGILRTLLLCQRHKRNGERKDACNSTVCQSWACRQPLLVGRDSLEGCRKGIIVARFAACPPQGPNQRLALSMHSFLRYCCHATHQLLCKSLGSQQEAGGSWLYALIRHDVSLAIVESSTYEDQTKHVCQEHGRRQQGWLTARWQTLPK